MDTQAIIALIAAIVIVLVALGAWYYGRRTTLYGTRYYWLGVVGVPAKYEMEVVWVGMRSVINRSRRW